MTIRFNKKVSINKDSMNKLLASLFADAEYIIIDSDEESVIMFQDTSLNSCHKENENGFSKKRMFGMTFGSDYYETVIRSLERALEETNGTDYNIICSINVRPYYVRDYVREGDDGTAKFVENGWIADVEMGSLRS